MADTNTVNEETTPIGYVPYTNGGITPNLGFSLMAFDNSMADQAALNNANWLKVDEMGDPDIEAALNYATRIAILEHCLHYQAAWIDSDGTLNLVLQDSTWVPEQANAEEVDA